MSNKEENKLPALSQNHQRFVDEYFKQGLNATAAYGIVFPNSDYESSKANASRLIANANIQIAITSRFEKLQQRNEIKIDNIISKINKLVDKCEQDDDRKNLLKALDQLSKMLGAYAPQKVEHINQAPLQINIIAPPTSPKLNIISPSKNEEILGLNPGEIDDLD